MAAASAPAHMLPIAVAKVTAVPYAEVPNASEA